MFKLAKFATFQQLSWAERMFFLRAVWMLLLIGAGLRLLGLGRLQALLQSGKSAPTTQQLPIEAAQQARRTAYLVSAAARHGFYRASCLPTSLVLRQLLLRQGIAADMRLGVRKAGDKLEAHAWVEHQGLPLIDGPDVHEHFAAFEQPLHPGAGASA